MNELALKYDLIRVVLDFDGGSSCNNPSIGYGEGYGSFRINNRQIYRRHFGPNMSANHAEIATLVEGVMEIDKLFGLNNIHLIVHGDSQIALGRFTKNRRQFSKRCSIGFIKACEELSRLAERIPRLDLEWHPRDRSLAIFGH